MSRILLISALMASSAQAEPWQAGVHLVSIHERAGFETFTPGLYLRSVSGLTVGLLSNSYGLPSAYAAQTWETADQRFALSLGVITGYPSAPVSPLLVPSWRVGAWQGLALRVSYIPKPPRDGASSALHISIEATD
jgi:hypothetical protein